MFVDGAVAIEKEALQEVLLTEPLLFSVLLFLRDGARGLERVEVAGEGGGAEQGERGDHAGGEGMTPKQPPADVGGGPPDGGFAEGGDGPVFEQLADIGGHFADGSVAQRGIEFGGAVADGFEFRPAQPTQVPEPGRFGLVGQRAELWPMRFEELLTELGRRAGGDGEGESVEDELGQEHAQGVHVGAGGGFAEVLRRGIGRGHVGAVSPFGVAEAFRDAEVEQLDAIAAGEDVAGLEIAMDDADVVRGLDGVAHLEEELETCVEGHGLGGGEVDERQTGDEFHGEVHAAVGKGVEVMDLHDAGVVATGEQVGLVAQARHAVASVGEAGAQDLEGDGSAVCEVDGAIDAAHAAFAERLADAVRTDDGADERIRPGRAGDVGEQLLDDATERFVEVAVDRGGFDVFDGFEEVRATGAAVIEDDLPFRTGEPP